MLNAYRALSLTRQLFIACLLLLTIIFSTLTFVVAQQINRNTLQQVEKELQSQVQVLENMLELSYKTIESRSEKDAESFEKFLAGKVSIGSELVRTGDVDIPALKLGTEILNGNTKILKEFRGITGGTDGALLVKYNGKLYRAATLLKNKEGNSMEGVPLPDDDPVTKAIFADKEYAGLTVRNGAFNYSRVKPIIQDGKTIGALSIRISLDATINQLKEIMRKIVSGESGYVFMLKPMPGDDIGFYVLHPTLDYKTVGKNVPEKARWIAHTLLNNKRGVLYYDYEDKRDNKIKPKVAVYGYSKSWDWVIATGSFVEEYTRDAIKVRNLLIFISIAAALLTIIAIFWLLKLRLRPLELVLSYLEKIGQGDMSVRIPTQGGVQSQNELDRLAAQINKTSAGIGDLIGNIAHSAQALGETAGGLRQAADQVAHSSGTQSQAASSMAAAVEELTVSIGQVAENAREAADVANQALQASAEGKVVVGQGVAEMERIAAAMETSAQLILSLGERSGQVSSVVNVIKEIADQTNLLALNAAIEAARAGEQGRGFAVVADEVRQLAERTASSTQEIAQTIHAIQTETAHAVEQMQSVTSQMQQGVQLVKAAGDSLSAIDARTAQAVHVVGDIASATREQSAASTDIAQRVEAIAHTAEEGSHVAHHNSQAAAQLLNLAQNLQQMVGQFKTR